MISNVQTCPDITTSFQLFIHFFLKITTYKNKKAVKIFIIKIFANFSQIFFLSKFSKYTLIFEQKNLSKDFYPKVCNVQTCLDIYPT